MKQWGCAGLIAGGIIGLLLLFLLILVTRPVAPPDITHPPTIPPDATIFVSERSLSRIATRSAGQAATIDFNPNGQMQVTTRLKIRGFEPVVTVGLLLEMQGTEVVSRLQWVKMGFLTVPAVLLPGSAHNMAAIVGQTIAAQTPPDFILVGLTTSIDGLTFQLKWAGG